MHIGTILYLQSLSLWLSLYLLYRICNYFNFYVIQSQWKNYTSVWNWIDKKNVYVIRYIQQAHYKAGHPQCFLDALFNIQEETESGEFKLSDNDIFGLDDSIIFGGLFIISFLFPSYFFFAISHLTRFYYDSFV